MKNILIIGAGRSAASLIDYLLEHSTAEEWQLVVADVSLALAEEKTAGHPQAKAIAFDVHNAAEREREIGNADLVVSMLPAAMHMEVANDCLRLGKHLATASYVSAEMRALDAQVRERGLIFLNECGVDPGIDHMSAMKIIDEVRSRGEEVIAFHSYCGGLIAPESNTNPWGYKFTWSPRNVVLAGQGGDAKWIEDGKMKSLTYANLFYETQTIDFEGYGSFDAYANRDSLSYRTVYGLDNIPTMMRGTLRMPGFCMAWDKLISLGLTDASKNIQGKYKTWSALMQGLHPDLKDMTELLDELGVDDEACAEKLLYLELYSDRVIADAVNTPAEALQALLEDKWKLGEHDLDLIVMKHEFLIRRKDGSERKIHASLVVKGQDRIHTAMAMTVGLPLAIAVRLIMNHKIPSRGVVVPVKPEFYEPVLAELAQKGIVFHESEN